MATRRQFLTIASAAMGGVGVGVAAWPFLRAWSPNAKAKAVGGPISVDLSTLEEGGLVSIVWRGRPILVLHHSGASIDRLQGLGDSGILADPASENAEQPEGVDGISRSNQQNYSVLVGLCTHLGCAPKFFPKVEAMPFDAEWQGGFFCPCHGSKFDLAGRVYSGVPAPTNLPVPPHSFQGSTLTIGEEV